LSRQSTSSEDDEGTATKSLGPTNEATCRITVGGLVTATGNLGVASCNATFSNSGSSCGEYTMKVGRAAFPLHDFSAVNEPTLPADEQLTLGENGILETTGAGMELDGAFT